MFNCNIYCSANGINIKNVSDGIIKGCNIENCELTGISLNSSGHITIENSSIHNEERESVGISISIGTVTLENNQIFRYIYIYYIIYYRNRIGLRLFTSNPLLIHNNNIFHNNVGIFIDGRQQVTYTVNRPKHAEISNNIISTNEQNNFILSAGSSPHIHDNIISESEIGLTIRDGSCPTIVYIIILFLFFIVEE